MTIDVRVPAGATADESGAIIAAIEAIVKRQPSRTPSVATERSQWAAAARREALDDRV